LTNAYKKHSNKEKQEQRKHVRKILNNTKLFLLTVITVD